MRRGRTLLLSALGAMGTTLFLSSALGSNVRAGEPESTEVPPLTEAYAEATVQMIYGRLEDRVRESGHDLSVSVSGFRTIWSDGFYDYHWADLVTFPGGPTLNTSLHYFADRQGGIEQDVGVRVDAHWEEVEDWLAAQPARFHELTYQDVLEDTRGQEAGRVEALTTYTVELQFAGRSRTYQAATEWHATKEGERPGIVHDHVIPGIMPTVGVELEVMREHPMLALEPLQGGTSGAGSCVELANNIQMKDPPGLPTGDSFGHVNGRHEAQAFHNFRCECNEDCVSRCTPSQYLPPICQDFGILTSALRCHRRYLTTRSAPAFSAVEGAECASAMGCHFEDCLSCSCAGIVLSVTGDSSGLSITDNGASLWGFDSTPTGQCFPCTFEGPPAPPPLPCPNPRPPPELRVLPVLGYEIPADSAALEDYPLRGPLGGVEIVERAGFEDYPLERVEILDGIRYTMEEWAVFEIERNEAGLVTDVRIPAASSTEYGSFQRRSLLEHLEGLGQTALDSPSEDSSRSVLLVIHEPRHRANARWIPTPNPSLRHGNYSIPDPGRTVAVVRADYGEDRSLIAFDVLYSDRPLTEEERSFIEDDLYLIYGSPARHRVVLYAVLHLGDDRVALDRWEATLPECCALEE